MHTVQVPYYRATPHRQSLKMFQIFLKALTFLFLFPSNNGIAPFSKIEVKTTPKYRCPNLTSPFYNRPLSSYWFREETEPKRLFVGLEQMKEISPLFACYKCKWLTIWQLHSIIWIWYPWSVTNFSSIPTEIPHYFVLLDNTGLV